MQEPIPLSFTDTEQDVLSAIGAAHDALPAMRRLPNHARAKVLADTSRALAARREELAVSITRECGKPIKDARIEADRSAHVFQIASEEALRFGGGELMPLERLASSEGRWGMTRRFPAGVVGAISPFNFPLNLVAHKLAPALAVGCPVVLKPAHQTPRTGLLLVDIINEAGAGILPDGALRAVYCEPKLGTLFATDERIAVLSFTGSDRIGWELKAKANRKKVILELGGNAAVIVHDDADLDLAVARCVVGAYSYAGQVCISIQRLLVQERIYNAFISAFVARTEKLTVGDPMDEATDIGPMLTEDAAKKVGGQVHEAVAGGARILCGGKRDGAFYAPTLLSNVPRDSALYTTEAFAPIAVIEPYAAFDEALARTNDSAFGLQAGVFTQSLPLMWKAFETLDVGGVIGNDIPTYRIDQMPYGGVKNSGFGREGVIYAMEEMSELRLLALNKMT